jgi:hypothetical protein
MPLCVARVTSVLLALATFGAGKTAEAKAQADTTKDASSPGDSDVEMNDAHDQQQRAQQPGASSPARPEVDAASEPPKKEDENDPDKKFTVSGTIETFYQWNFNEPGNGISAYRGYDTRHNSLTLQNAVIDVGFRAKDLLARVALQVGHAPAIIYQDEPDQPGSDTVAPSNAQLWRYLQRASLGWQASKLLLLEAGLFPSVTGVESLAVKENWNWSRSTSSVRLPNYHAGIRATWNLSDRVDLFTAVINGWNNVVDNNDEKSVIVGAHYKYEKKLTLSGSYFGGVERDGGAAEGRAWRHGFEAWAQLDATDRLSFAADTSAGFERTRFGTAWWTSAAAYARVKLLEWLFAAARGDRTWEDTAGNAQGGSEPILIPAKHITSVTGTVEVRPVKGLSARLEYRNDQASEPLYFRGNVQGDGSAQNPYVANAKHQSSVLLGLAAWF